MLGLARPLVLAAACLAAAFPAAAERDSFLDERPGIGEPLRFRDASGGAFRPRVLVLRGAEGSLAADLPSGARSARSENRVDLSSVPLIGSLFRGTLDVASAREGAFVGTVYRVGDTLVVDAARPPSELASRRVALSTNLPRVGAVSFGLGRLDWTPVAMPAPEGAPIGSAHLVEGGLVLASQGGEPAWPSVEALFRDLF